MKIHNIATFGIIAAIFGSTGQALATTIASQAYVDAKDALKQDKLNAGTGGNVTVDNSSTTAASRAITGITATGNGNITFTTQPISVSTPAATTYVTDNDTSALSISNASTTTDKAPSVKAVYKMVQPKQTLESGQTISNVTQYTSTTTNGDVKVPTVQAVGQQLEKFADANSTVLNSGITSTKVGTYDTTATAVSNAITTNAINAADDYLVKTNAIKGSVLYVGNTDSTNTKTTNKAISSVTGNSSVFSTNTTVAADSDAYVPTVAAVEARIKGINIPTVPDTTDTKSATYDSSAHTLTVATSGDGASTTKVATPKQVANTITDVKSYIDYKATTLDTTASASYSNGALTVVTTSNAAGNKTDQAATTSQVASTTSAVKSYVDYKAGLKADKASGLTAATTKYNTVKYNADGIVTGGTDLTSLADVNTTSSASCDENNPCVLTYYKKNGATYMRWTPMMTEDTAANITVTSGDTAASS